MISGKVALGGLTVEFGNAETRFAELAEEVKALTRAHKKLLADERALVEELARTYLPELTARAVAAGLAELRERMEAALARQAAHRRELEDRLRALPEDVARRELIVAERERGEEHAAAALDAVRRAVEEELGGDDSHARDVAEHRAIMERRSILKSRRARLQTTANVERHDYEADDAFAYLMRRGYGEPRYAGRLLARWLDGRLAARIEYETLLRNYRILRTGPHAIQAELRTLSERATELERAIDERETDVAERRGLTAALEAEAAAQRALVDARGALDEARALHDRLAAEIRAVDANRGRPYEDAIAMHREFLADRSIAELDTIARSTADPKDDALVDRIDEIRGRLRDIGDELGRHREELSRQAARTTSLADLARNAVARFASRRSAFPEDFNLGRLVASIVDGDASTEDALGTIAESHVRRPLLAPTRNVALDGWFAELSSEFDPELGAVTVEVEGSDDVGAEVIVYDHHGRVLQRRVTKRRGQRPEGH